MSYIRNKSVEEISEEEKKKLKDRDWFWYTHYIKEIDQEILIVVSINVGNKFKLYWGTIGREPLNVYHKGRKLSTMISEEIYEPIRFLIDLNYIHIY